MNLDTIRYSVCASKRLHHRSKKISQEEDGDDGGDCSAELRDFEDVLDVVGGWGRYQWRLFCIFFPFTLFLSYVAYSPVLFLYVPDHWCKKPPPPAAAANLSQSDWIELAIPVEDEGTGQRSKCFQYDLVNEEVCTLRIADSCYCSNTLIGAEQRQICHLGADFVCFTDSDY